MIVVADTSALIAGFDPEESEHVAARAVLEREQLLIAPLVLTELDHLVHRDFGFTHALEVLDSVLARVDVGRYVVPDIAESDLLRAQQVRRAYASLELDLADGVAVVLADRYRTDQIFTLDQRGFRAVRPLTERFTAFRLLPADL